ncbi:acyl-CoA N-acyltransferase [Catenaria anguillulae PL171]|uniref:histone acetyltransferase n=1 Tax=Catenaria anguillulae PL171 TaxID=765915 RepID=A0A1Y2HVT2_9FUNG|nr:acyl-CoA N-acyltransferase [Catenaria anguillulae PL171]
MDDDTASMGSQTATDLDSTLLADGSSSQPGSPGTSRPSTPTPFASGGSGKGKENETPSTAGPPGTFSKADEREKLRVGGSMTQCVSEISRVKNLNKLVMGKHIVEPWYFSPYPQEVAHLDTLWLCEFCLGYFVSARSLERHRTKCTLTHPPGNEIYRKDNISFFEIDGRRQKQYCRNLCLVSKCFLDHKTLYYDVDPFMFYLMTVSDEHGSHLVGYFSKEKESAEGYNLACILTLPQHQRKGYGRLLIQFSYELSKVEGKPGSPEKPLSDLGLLSYRAYWTEVLVDHLVHRSDCTIDDLARETCILVKDIMDTLVALNAVRYYKGSYVIVLSKACLEAQERSKRKNKVSIDPKCLEWRPPSWVGKEKYLN